MDRNIRNASERIKGRMRGSHCTASNYRNLCCGLNRFCRYAESRDEADLTEDLVNDYIRELSHDGQRKPHSYQVKAIVLLCEELELAPSSLAHRFQPKEGRKCYEVPERFGGDYELYLDHLSSGDLSPDSIRGKERAARKLLAFLDDRLDGLGELTLADCDAFFEKEAEKATRRTINILYSYVREFVAFLEGAYDLPDISSVLMTDRRRPAADQVQRFLTEDEVRRILEAAAKSSIRPKRSVLIVAMMLQYMMRATDLLSMSLDDINWAQNTIRIASSKNGKERIFPLTETMRYLILDYVKNERPRSDSRRLILSCHYPYGPLGDSNTLTSVVKRIARDAGVEIEGTRFGCHALRRTGATALMGEGIDYSAIADVLMHSMRGTSLSMSTVVYLRMDIENLRDAALEVLPYARR